MFNPDEAFYTITEVEDSILYDMIEQEIINNIIKMDKDNDYEEIKIDTLKLESKRGRMYDNDYLTWGQVSFNLKSSSPFVEDQKKLYRFITADAVTDFRKISSPLEQKNSSGEGEVVANKSMKLAFFIRGEKLDRQITELEYKLVQNIFI